MHRAETEVAPLRALPHLPTRNPLGHLRAMRDDPLHLFLHARDAFGGLGRVRAGPHQIVVVSRPDLIEEVLVRHPDRYRKQSRGYALLRTLLGGGLLTAEGEAWKTRRRLSQPAFRPRSVTGFAQAMVEETEASASRLVSGEPLDLADWMSRLTLRIVCRTLFGTSLGEAREARVGQALDEAMAGFDQLVASPVPWSERLPLPATLRFRRAKRALHEVTDALVAERQARPPGDDLLHALISAHGDGADADTLRDDVLTLLLAGHETTASALGWTLWLLALHPPTARALRQELSALGDRPATVADLPDLVLLDRVLRESLRLYPPAWIIGRAAVEDCVLDGYHIPAGTLVFVVTWAVHRDPTLWPDPSGFDPDRWANPPVHKLAWIPFGAGQRKCIGDRFAMMEAKLVLATLLRRWRFEAVPGWPVELDPSVTLRPKRGLGMVPLPC